MNIASFRNEYENLKKSGDYYDFRRCDYRTYADDSDFKWDIKALFNKITWVV